MTKTKLKKRDSKKVKIKIWRGPARYAGKKTPIKHRKIRELSSHETKIWAALDCKQICQLPSCKSRKPLEELDKHHWDYLGGEEDITRTPFSPRLIHPMCYKCHDLAHKIAGVIIQIVEKIPRINVDILVQKVGKILIANADDIIFVLKKELKRARLVRMYKQEKEEKCSLTKKGKKRAWAIKEYLRINAPEIIEKVEIELGIKPIPLYQRIYNYISLLMEGKVKESE